MPNLGIGMDMEKMKKDSAAPAVIAGYKKNNCYRFSQEYFRNGGKLPRKKKYGFLRVVVSFFFNVFERNAFTQENRIYEKPGIIN